MSALVLPILSYDYFVRFSDFPYLADWFAVAFRWMAVLGLAVSLSRAEALTVPAGVILLLIVAWNVFISFLAALNRRLPQHRPTNLLVDFALAVLLFAFTGGITGPVAWTAVLPLLSAALYYSLPGSLLTALAISLAQAGWTAAAFPQLVPLILIPAGIVAAANLLLALLFGLLGRLLIRAVRAVYRQRMEAAQKAEAHAQSGERTRLQKFYRLLEALTATLDYQTVLENSLDLMAQGLDMSPTETGRLVSAVLLFDESEGLMVASARRFSPTDLKRRFPAQQGALGESLKSGNPLRVTPPAEDPELGQIVALHGCASAACLPLARGLDAYGLLLAGHPEPDFFSAERVDLLEVLAHQVAIAVQNARLFEELHAENQRIEAGQEEARKNLARDLHDGPVQTISAIAMRAATARRLLEAQPASAGPELEWVESAARRATEEIRHLLFTLRPLVLEAEGLGPALHALAERMGKLYNQNVRVDVDPAIVERIDPARQSTVFSLAEEAVNNARKHAQASLITLRLRAFTQDGSVALLEVADNGRGFDKQAVERGYAGRGSLGMINLRERAELMHGYLNLQTAPGKGTRVQVFIPLTPQAAERLQRGMLADEGAQ